MKIFEKKGIFFKPKENHSIYHKFLLSVPLLASLLVLISGCVVAPFSDVQSAKMVGPGHFEVTPHYSKVSFSGGGETEKVHDNFGLQFGVGVLSFMDFRARYERIQMDEDVNVNVFGLGPKFSLVKDWAAFYAPVGFAFGEDIDIKDTFQFHPTLLFTLPTSRYFELNPSVKVLVPLRKGSDIMVALNLGLGISSDLEKWAIRPEIGFLFNPGEEGHCFHFSIGLTVNTKISGH